jgi:dTDP-4-amino-4,6-dideoxygalactose transaminase
MILTKNGKSVDPGRLCEIAPQSGRGGHLHVVRVPDRRARADYLRGRGIETRLHNPQSLNETGACRHHGWQLPLVEAACRTVLSPPMHSWLTNKEIQMAGGASANGFRQHEPDAAKS